MNSVCCSYNLIQHEEGGLNNVHTKGGQVYCQASITVGTFEHTDTTCMQLENDRAQLTEKGTLLPYRQQAVCAES